MRGDNADRLRTFLQVRKCTGCGLYEKGRGPVPFTEGSGNVAVVGEAPGRTEDALREPFVGKAGTLLRQYLTDAGMDLTSISFLNVVSCWPDRTPHTKEVEACRTNLLAQLDFLDPQWILVLGGVAVKALCPVDLRMGLVRGHWWKPFNGKSVWAMATWHPSAVLRNPRELGPEAREDIELFSLASSRNVQMGQVVGGFCCACKQDATRWAGEGIPFCGEHYERYVEPRPVGRR